MSTPKRIVRFLTTAQVTRFYETNIMQASPSQLPMLESAVASPQNHYRYGQNDIFQLAGTLAERIILNHPYQDGNKRTALLAADMFLKINGLQLQEKSVEKDDANEVLKQAQVAVADIQWSAENLAECYRAVARPLAEATAETDQY
ncbi:hypothetical protein SEPCBS119000_003896 [Sporothrix epigloea]|uniref:Fido domain-containing protein n=1 Tax=Sporothrix epigloea TaxID=1892477 RepID=A0ABP0DTA1_9PEZI